MDNEQKVEDTSKADGGQQTVEELQAELTKARADAAKERGIRTKLQQERDNAKKSQKESADEDYKSLWTQEKERAEKLLDRAKQSAVESAVKAKLTKAGVLADAIDAATKLIDRELVVWDDEGGVDEVSAQAAVAKLKGQFGFMFEKKVSANEPKQSADKVGSGEKTMSRAAFDALSPLSKSEKMKGGWKLFD
jgi:hypothetical protein